MYIGFYGGSFYSLCCTVYLSDDTLL